MIKIADLEVTFCWHGHERNWQWRPLNEATVMHIKTCVRDCLLAKLWLNANCAHSNLHTNDANKIFETWLLDYNAEEKQAILADWDMLSQLNSRVDQLHRFGNGGNLDQIAQDVDLLEERRYESEDSSLRWAVLSLPETDPLRTILLCAGSMSDKKQYIAEYWQLLEQAEQILVKRKWCLLDWVKNRHPHSALIFTALNI